MVAHACMNSSQEAEAERSHIQGQSSQHSESLSQNAKENKKGRKREKVGAKKEEEKEEGEEERLKLAEINNQWLMIFRTVSDERWMDLEFYSN